MPIDALSVLCVTIAKFLLVSYLVTPKDIATESEKLRPDDRSTTKQTLTAISQTVEKDTNKQTNKQTITAVLNSRPNEYWRCV